MLGCDSCAVA